MQPASVQRANQDENPATVSIRMRRRWSGKRGRSPTGAKKKEPVDDGREPGVPPARRPEDVRVHDFLINKLGRAMAYGFYDLAANAEFPVRHGRRPASAAIKWPSCSTVTVAMPNVVQATVVTKRSTSDSPS
jgi:hypothetical protein